MRRIRFQAKLTAIGSQTILRLPAAASSKLPSRGMSLFEGTFNIQCAEERVSAGVTLDNIAVAGSPFTTII
jgi:hypothetical protein